MISARLRVVGGKHANQMIPLNQKKFLIGREQDCQLRPNSELVSRHHCIFTVDDFSLRLRDLGSTNGTLVNGERIRKEVVLNAADRVTVGSLEFEVLLGSPQEQVAPVASPAEDTIVQAGSETLNEMVAISPEAAANAVEQIGDVPAASPEAQAAVETPAAPAAEPVAEAPAAEPAAQPEAAPQAPAAPEVPPPASTGDTTVIAQPVMMPGQTPYQPMMPPMGYPQQPMYGAGYGYPGMPPQPMPMYPQPGYPPAQGYPGAAAPPASEEAPAAAPAASAQEVSLPDPTETGAKDPEPAPPKPEGEAASQGESEKSNQSAAAIIQQHMQRRPGG